MAVREKYISWHQALQAIMDGEIVSSEDRMWRAVGSDILRCPRPEEGCEDIGWVTVGKMPEDDDGPFQRWVKPDLSVNLKTVQGALRQLITSVEEYAAECDDDTCTDLLKIKNRCKAYLRPPNPDEARVEYHIAKIPVGIHVPKELISRGVHVDPDSMMESKKARKLSRTLGARRKRLNRAKLKVDKKATPKTRAAARRSRFVKW